MKKKKITDEEEDYTWQKKNRSRESRVKEESKGVKAENCALK